MLLGEGGRGERDGGWRWRKRSDGGGGKVMEEGGKGELGWRKGRDEGVVEVEGEEWEGGNDAMKGVKE